MRRGRGFAYVHTDGGTAGRAERARIADLAVPPAWEDVWIADAPNAHILAVGVDAAGRRQYLYHPVWREKQDAEKFLRMTALAEVLPAARRTVRRDLALEELPRERVLAAAFRTLDLGAIRIGSEESLAGFRSRGLTTLLVRNAALDPRRDGAVPVPREGRHRRRTSACRMPRSRRSSSATRERSAACAALRLVGGAADARGARRSDVNEDIRARTGGDFTAKDFRTLRGTIAAADRLARARPRGHRAGARARHPRGDRACERRARQHARRSRRRSYVDPRVVAAYEHGRVIGLRGGRETALLALLVDDAGEA